MYSKKKNIKPVRKKPINWTNVLFIIFGLIMVVGFIITAIAP
jgi:hypothetical protein